jgi:hypothetical protein
MNTRVPPTNHSTTGRTDGRVAIPPTPAALKPIPKQSLIPGLEKIRGSNNKLPHPNSHWPQPKGASAKSSEASHLKTVESQESKPSRQRKATADYVRPLIQKEPFWPNFHDTKGHVKSNAEAVKSLEFFEDLVKKYVGQVIPADVDLVGGRRITKVFDLYGVFCCYSTRYLTTSQASLLEAVGRGTTWGSDCHIVLGKTIWTRVFFLEGD